MILTTGIIALAQLFIIATTANRQARSTTSTMLLAQQKMEQLRSLSWGFDVLGLPLSDTNTDISVFPFTQTGSGLAPSPAGTLTQNVAGFVDYLDQYGNWLGTGAAPVANTIYIRRWSIEPLPTNPNNTLVLQVLVTRFRNRGTADQDNVARLPEEARLVSVKSRKTI